MIDGVRSAGDPDFVVQLAADPSGLPGLVDQVEAYAAAMALPQTVALRLTLVCEEWAANVVAEDDGPPFDPLSVPAPDVAATLEGRRVGGLGLYLMRRVAQDVRYERAESLNRLALALDIGHDGKDE